MRSNVGSQIRTGRVKFQDLDWVKSELRHFFFSCQIKSHWLVHLKSGPFFHHTVKPEHKHTQQAQRKGLYPEIIADLEKVLQHQ